MALISYIIYSVVVECTEIIEFWNGLGCFIGLLVTLQLLHLFWFYTIATMIYRLFTTGIEKDERSDSDEDEEVELEQNATNLKKEKQAYDSVQKVHAEIDFMNRWGQDQGGAGPPSSLLLLFGYQGHQKR